MDTGMRDLEQLEEQPREGTAKAAMIVLAAVSAMGLVFAMSVVMGDGSIEAQDAEDPLAALDNHTALAASVLAAEPEPVAEVDRQALSFPATLVDERPEVAAALAAAAAEHDHLDPIPRRALGFQVAVPAANVVLPQPALPQPALPEPNLAAETLSNVTALGATLPAAVSAGPEGVEIAQTALHDPMVAAALPSTEPSEEAEAGEDGDYTLQIISYRTNSEAEVFAEALRKRGHRTFVTSAEIDGRGTFHRVRVGPFTSQREANDYRRTFEREERMNTFVVRRR